MTRSSGADQTRAWSGTADLSRADRILFKISNRTSATVKWPISAAPMKRSKFTDEQILAIVKEGEAGRKVADLCRTHGITEQTYYRWKAKYGGMELSEMQRLKQLEDENRRLKQIVAEQTLDIQALKAVVAKKWWAPSLGARRWGGCRRAARVCGGPVA